MLHFRTSGDAYPSSRRELPPSRTETIILLAGPALLAAAWILIPVRAAGGGDAAARSPVVVEAIGVRAGTAGDGRPLVMGYSRTADLRLPGLNGPGEAAVLYPPPRGGEPWRIAAATPEVPVWLRGRTSSDTTPVATLAPWKGRSSTPLVVEGEGVSLRVEHVPLHEVTARTSDGRKETGTVDLAGARALVLRGSGRVILSCPDGKTPRFLAARHAAAPGDPQALCARLPQGGDASWRPFPRCRRLPWQADCHRPSGEPAALLSGTGLASPRVVRAWAEPVAAGPLWISLAGDSRDSLRLTYRPAAVLDSVCGNGAPCAPPAPLAVRAAAGGAPLGTLAPIRLEPGSLLVLGARTLLVPARAPGDPSRLDLLYVRKPRAPSVLRAGSGADLYHPSARAVWRVPPCAGDSARLRLVVGGTGESAPAAQGVDLGALDRRFSRALSQAAGGSGTSSALGGALDGREERTFALCQQVDSGRTVLHLTGGQGGAPGAPAAGLTADLGSAGTPREALVPLGTVLVRAGHPSDGRAQRRTRAGLAGFLLTVLALQAVPLHRARRRRAERAHELRDDPDWPADVVPEEPGPATVLQLTGAIVCALLFMGTSYQLALAADPRLAGAPDYAQSFIDAVMLVGMILAGAAWGCLHDGSLRQRIGDACLGAGLAALAALAWWMWDGAGIPAGLELTRERSAANVAFAGGTARKLVLAAALVAVPLVLPWLVRLGDAAARAWREQQERRNGRERRDRRPRRSLGAWPGFVLCLLAGAVVAKAQHSALGFELGVLAALSWYTAAQWDFVVGDGAARASRASPESPLANVVGGVLILSVFLFLAMGAKVLPTSVSVVVGLLGLAGFAVTWYRIHHSAFHSLNKLLLVWFVATGVGGVICVFLLRDLGSMAAWLPALVCGFLLWTVRPEEPRNTPQEVRRTWLYLALAGSAGLFLLGVLDIGSAGIEALTGDQMTRERQRVVLAQDVSYLSAGEWITQVRWLAAGQTGGPAWVPNLNSDVALFGVGAVFGRPAAWLASLGAIAIAAGLAWTCDQALRQGWAAEQGAAGTASLPTLLRAAGLFLGMVAILLLAQWLVHLTTGVDLRYPITGLVFPWISHGNTSHLLFTAAAALPLAAVAALEDTLLRPYARGA